MTPASQPPQDTPKPGLEVATVGGGCFWCVEAAMSELKGVVSAVSGYAGGRKPDPTYEEVCSGTSGHVEVVQVTFDPKAVSYREILEVLFLVHDPTSVDRQGADVGEQYRSIIYTHGAAQEEVARGLIRELGEAEVFDRPIVTRVEPAPPFYPAEEHHQRYFERNPYQGYCMAVIRPKMQKFRKAYAERLKTA